MVALLCDRTPELCEAFDSEASALARIDDLARQLAHLKTEARPQ